MAENEKDGGVVGDRTRSKATRKCKHTRRAIPPFQPFQDLKWHKFQILLLSMKVAQSLFRNLTPPDLPSLIYLLFRCAGR